MAKIIMQSIIAINYLAMMAATTTSSTPVPISPYSAQTINVNVNNTATGGNAVANAHSAASQAYRELCDLFSKAYPLLQDAYQKSYQRMHDATLLSFQWVSNHKGTVLLSCVAGIYLASTARLWQLHIKLAQTTNWSLWQQTKSFEQLLEFAQKELAESLMLDIQRRYTSIQNPTDFVLPLVRFMQDIEYEIALLKEYQRICWYLEKSYLLRFTWHDQELLRTCQERMQRIGYLKNIFLSWIAEFKILNQPIPVTRIGMIQNSIFFDTRKGSVYLLRAALRLRRVPPRSRPKISYTREIINLFF